MPGWGLDPYGLSAFGGVSGLVGGQVGTAPLIVYQDPAPGSINVAEDALLTVTFFDVDLHTPSVKVYVNGVVAYSGTTGFAGGYLGRTQATATTLSVQIYKRGGWGYEKTITVRGFAADDTALTVDSTWSWSTVGNSLCYSGLTPLAVETVLTQPLQRFLGVEPLRALLLNAAIRRNIKAVTNDANKSARVVYQLAYQTELAVLQNAYLVKNTTALSSTVCEQQNTLNIDKTLAPQERLIRTAIDNLKQQQIIDERYVRELYDYLDTSLYHYRVSLAANLVLLAGAIEVV